MRPVSRRRGAIATVFLLAALTGCAGNGDDSTGAAPDPGTIGIAMPTKDSRWSADGDNMVKQFQALGYRTDIQYSDNDIQQQVGQVNAMISSGDRALVIGAVDGTALKDALQSAHDKQIPVISYDRLIRGSANVDYYATFDNFKVGVLQGTMIVNRLGLRRAKRAYRIELFAGSADDNNAGFFFNGAMSVLRPYLSNKNLIVPSGQTTFARATTKGWDNDVAAARMRRLLAGPDRSVTLDAVLAPNDGIARGILTEAQRAGYGKGGKRLPVVTGQDAELASVKLVNQGIQAQTIYKDTRELAKVAVQMTDRTLSGAIPEINDSRTYDNGVKVVPTFQLQPVSVDRANLRTVLIDGGYYKDSDLS